MRGAILWFNLECLNIGNEDLVVGRPEDRHDIFERGEVFGWEFKDKFYTYGLKGSSVAELRSGYEVAFCLMDAIKFSCEYQGISAGNLDIYGGNLPCQFIVIDDILNGDYALEATAYDPSVDVHKTGSGRILFKEDN
jgi:lysyl oxidase